MAQIFGHRKSPKIESGLNRYTTNRLPLSSRMISWGSGRCEVSGRKKNVRRTERVPHPERKNLGGDHLDQFQEHLGVRLTLTGMIAMCPVFPSSATV